MTNEPAPVTLWDAVGEFIVRHPEMTLAQLTEDADFAEYVNEYSVEELQGLAGISEPAPKRAPIVTNHPEWMPKDQPWRKMSDALIDDLVLEQIDTKPLKTREVHALILRVEHLTGGRFPMAKVLDSLRRLVNLGLVKRSGQTSTTAWAIDA